MIKTTLGKIARLLDSGPASPLTKMAAADDRTNFANKVVISRFLRALNPEILEYQKSLAALGAKHGKPSPEHGGQLVVTGEAVSAYRQELAEVESVKVEISGTSPLPGNVVENLGLTPADLILLEDFIALT